MEFPGSEWASISIDEQELQLRKRFLGLSSDDATTLEALREIVGANHQMFVDDFYDHLSTFEETAKHISEDETLARLKRAQHRYAVELLSGNYDLDYARNRLQVGFVHHRIGLAPHLYLAACGRLITGIAQSLPALFQEGQPKGAEALIALVRVLMLDVGFAMDAYVHADRKALADTVASLRDSQSRLAESQELAQLAHWELVPESGELRACARTLELLCMDPTSALPAQDRLRQWIHPDDRRMVDDALESAMTSDATYDIRYRVECVDGRRYALRERGRALRDPDGRALRVIGVIQDISLQSAQLSRIEQLAHFDNLTGLPNRAHFYAALDRAISACMQNGGSFSLLFIDLDNFKDINDTKGHGIGDLALVEIAKRIKGYLRSQDLVARLGGDEFVVLAERTDAAAARKLAMAIVECLTPAIWVRGEAFRMKASIGISSYPLDGEDSERLVRNADTAMYAAKRSRSGIEAYRADMSRRLERRIDMASRLDQALRHGELQLHYQPQVRLDDGGIVGMEALLRWHDTELGWIRPDEFIPLAEERGMIDAVGDFVVGQACAQIRAWRGAGLLLPGRLALNISAMQLDADTFSERLITAVTRAGLSPTEFDLELTESGIMVDPVRSLAIMKLLKAAGFSLSVDDFGMGYSSLSHLKGFPFDKIKLDGSFVQGMLTDRSDYAIVMATVTMARNLGLQLVAEGVETADQAVALKSIGCELAQGFLYGRACPPEVFAARWLQSAPAAGH